jgi:raffinose/stachyose/melibiose transport system permease protein
LLAVVGSFTTYNLIYVLTGGMYGTQTLGMLAFNAAFGSFEANLGYGAAVLVVLFLMTLVVAIPLMVLLRYRERRLFG